MDLIVEKAAELGATELWPLLCARSVAKAPGDERVARWRRLALAASKQSLAIPPLHVLDAISFDRLIQIAPRDTLALMCFASADAIGSVLSVRKPSGLLIAIGPEGDFDDHEISAAKAAGFVGASLGPNRLRSETAALVALALAGEWQRGSNQ